MKNLLDRNRAGREIEVKQSGFTLIELMVVIVIIGILLKIAVPAYTSFVQRAYRTDAKTALLDLATREEKFYSVNNQYTATLSNLYPGTTATSLNVQSGGTSYYTISAPTVTAASTSSAASFTASAVPVTGTAQASDPCGTFTITSTGATSVSGSLNNCW